MSEVIFNGNAKELLLKYGTEGTVIVEVTRIGIEIINNDNKIIRLICDHIDEDELHIRCKADIPSIVAINHSKKNDESFSNKENKKSKGINITICSTLLFVGFCTGYLMSHIVQTKY